MLIYTYMYTSNLLESAKHKYWMKHVQVHYMKLYFYDSYNSLNLY